MAAPSDADPGSIALDRLIVVPLGGLCNRFRAIASGRRLCHLVGAKCTIVWDWDAYEDFFNPVSDVQFVPVVPEIAAKSVNHSLDPAFTLKADVTQTTLKVHSGSIFWGTHETVLRGRLDLFKPYYPTLNQTLQKTVDDFHSAYLTNAVGFHMRRAGHRPASESSPDELFFFHARHLIDKGKKIFLCADNVETEQRMKRMFGQSIVTYPKRTGLAQRWPRMFDRTATEDDLIDLFLLSKTKFVIGSFRSSYSETASLFNGSKHCMVAESSRSMRRRRRHAQMLAFADKYLPFLNRLLRQRWYIQRRRLRFAVAALTEKYSPWFYPFVRRFLSVPAKRP